jgi:hypothetical protein
MISRMSEFQSGLLAHAERIAELLPYTHSEADTRANLVEPVLRLLGYTGVGDIRREVAVPATKEYLDFELRADGRPLAIVEAKTARGVLTDQHAGQCVQYAAVLGIAWCVITNGTSWAIYNAYGKGPLQAKKVAQVRLNGSEAELKEAARILAMLSKEAMTHVNPLTSLLVERVVKDELSRSDSPAVAALRRAVRDRFGDQVGTQAILQAVDYLHGVPGDSGESPEPARGAFLPVTMPRAPRNLGAGSTIQRLVEGGLLPSDATIECRLYGVSHEARVRDRRIELNGQLYDTPSAAASALRNGKASNGLVIWKYKGELLSELRARLPGQGEVVSEPA